MEITNNTFIRSTNDPEARANLGSSSWFKSVTQSASSYKTPLIIAGAATAIMLAAAVSARMMLRKTSEEKGVNINNYNTNKASADNSNNMEGNMVGIEMNPLYPVLHGQAVAEEEEENDSRAGDGEGDGEREGEGVESKAAKEATEGGDAKEGGAVNEGSAKDDKAATNEPGATAGVATDGAALSPEETLEALRAKHANAVAKQRRAMHNTKTARRREAIARQVRGEK